MTTGASVSDVAWCRRFMACLRDGAMWAVPRSGLIFRREGDALVLSARMPWTDEMAEAAREGRDVPSSAGALRAYQDADYRLIQGRFRAAGFTVRDGTEAEASEDRAPCTCTIACIPQGLTDDQRCRLEPTP